jgi:hypothetical protein
VAANIYDDILSQCVNVVTALELSYVPPGQESSTAVEITKRALPRAQETLDKLPLVCVVPHPKAGEKVRQADFNSVFVEYPVFIVLIAASNQDFVSLLPTWIGWRGQIRVAFQPQHLKIPSAYIWRVILNMEVPLPNSLLQNQNYAYSAMGATFTTIEPRVPAPVPA